MHRFEDLFDDGLDGFHPDKKKRVGGYVLGRILGEGSFAKVRLGTHILTKEKVAVKIINKKLVNKREYVRRNMRREAMLLQRLQHPSIVRLYEVLETDNSYYIVLELADGVEFIKYINDREKLTEHAARMFMRQIVSAVDHMHRSGVVHRDLKIENFLLDKHFNIKLIDFGLGNQWDGKDLLSTQCGSPAYAAPEIFSKKQYSNAVDVWSLGVNMYAMLTGALPFVVDPPNNLTKLHSVILAGCKIPDFISSDARNLISRMLEPTDTKRITVRDILDHPWLNKDLPVLQPWALKARLPAESVNDTVVKYMVDRLNYTETTIRDAVTCHRANAMTATYNHLLKRLQRGDSLPGTESSSQAARDRIVHERQSVFRKFQMEVVPGLTETKQQNKECLENKGHKTDNRTNQLQPVVNTPVPATAPSAGQSRATSADPASENNVMIINHIEQPAVPRPVVLPPTPRSNYKTSLRHLRDSAKRKGVPKTELMDSSRLHRRKGVLPKSTLEQESNCAVLEHFTDIRDSGFMSSTSGKKELNADGKKEKSVKFKMIKNSNSHENGIELVPLIPKKRNVVEPHTSRTDIEIQPALPKEYHDTSRPEQSSNSVRIIDTINKQKPSPPPPPPNSALGHRRESVATPALSEDTIPSRAGQDSSVLEPPPALVTRIHSSLDSHKDAFYDRYKFKLPASYGRSKLAFESSLSTDKKLVEQGKKSRTMPTLRVRKLGAIHEKQLGRPRTRDSVAVNGIGAVYKVKEYNHNMWRTGNNPCWAHHYVTNGTWDSTTLTSLTPRDAATPSVQPGKTHRGYSAGLRNGPLPTLKH